MARNAALTLAGHVLPLAAAVVAIPITVRALGPVRFGLLGLSWALLEYLGLVELGLGRTSVRFVAQALARSAGELRQTVSVAVATQAALAAVGALALAAAAPFLANDVFSIPPQMRAEAIGLFRAVAANVLVVVLLGALRGVLEGAQRFGVSTAIKVPTATAAVLIPAIAAAAGASLGEIMWWVLLVRLAAASWLFAALPRLIPTFAWEPPRDWNRLRSLFAYSGWVAVSGVINPVLASFDRFALASLAGVAAVGVYTAPYEAAVRLLLIPTSMFAALFPALSATFARAPAPDEADRLLDSSLRQLTLVFAPPVMLLFVFAPEILGAWLGSSYVPAMTTAFRILLLGVLLNGLAHVPSVFIYAVGRPDLSAKIHIAELVLHVPLTIALVTAYGVRGAAVSWTIRIALDAVLLVWMSVRAGANWTRRSPAEWRGAVVALMALAVVLGLAKFAASPAISATALVAGSAVFVSVVWTRGLTGAERSAWQRLLRSR